MTDEFQFSDVQYPHVVISNKYMQPKLDTTATKSFRGHFQALKNSSDNPSSCLIAEFLFKMALVLSILGVPLNAQLSMMMEPSECLTSFQEVNIP